MVKDNVVSPALLTFVAMDWVRLAGFAVLLPWVAACAWYPLTDTDIWWHLAAGRKMLADGALLRTDPFSLVSMGKPWIDLHWGFQLMAFGLWKLGGPAALIAAKVAALWGALCLALRPHLDRRNAWLLLPLAGFACYHVRFHLDVRPLAVTLLGLALEYQVVMAFLAGRLRRPWLYLIPIQALLANVQGLYLLGAFLVTCFALPSRSRPLLWTAAALWLTGLLTPYGWDAFALPFRLLGRIAPTSGNVFSSGMAENQPFFVLAGQNPAAAAPFLLFGAAVLFTFDRARGRTSLGHAMLFAGFALLGAMAVRNLPLFCLAGLMAAARNLQVSPLPSEASASRRFAWAGAALGLALLAACIPRIRAAWAYELPGRLETPFRLPHGASEYLARHPIGGNIFNELRHGGYLAWRFPGKPAFIDGRMILRDAAFYGEFLEVVDGLREAGPYLDRYGITHAVLPIGEDRRFLPLAARLWATGWTLLYCDGADALLVPPGSPSALESGPGGGADGDRVRAALLRRFHSNPRLEELAAANVATLAAETRARGRALDGLRF